MIIPLYLLMRIWEFAIVKGVWGGLFGLAVLAFVVAVPVSVKADVVPVSAPKEVRIVI